MLAPVVGSRLEVSTAVEAGGFGVVGFEVTVTVVVV